MRITDLNYCDLFRFRGKDLIYQFETCSKFWDGKIHFSYYLRVNGKMKRYKSTGDKFVEVVEKSNFKSW